MTTEILYDHDNGELVLYNTGYKPRDHTPGECAIIAESIKIYSDFIVWAIAETDMIYIYIKNCVTLITSTRDKRSCRHIVYDRELYVFDSNTIFSVYNPDNKWYNAQHYDYSEQVPICPLIALNRILNDPYDGSLVEYAKGILRSPYIFSDGFWDMIIVTIE